MWKKDEPTAAAPQPAAPQAPERQPAERPPLRSREPAASAPAAHDAPPARAPRPEQAAIGPSITIRGEVTGDEDLLIQGTVEGSVDLGHHAVEVGREGRVKANITGRVVTVEGSVEGDLLAEEQIVLRPSAEVRGDITAPRVVLEDGARFRGMVEMGEAAAGKAARKGAEVGKDANGASSRTASGSTTKAASNASTEDAPRKEAAPSKSSSEKAGASKATAEKAESGSGKSRSEPEKVAEAR